MARLSIKRVIVILLILALIGGIIFAIRGPYTSNCLKKIILGQLETASGRQVIADKLYINIFPLFIGVKDIKVFDEQGLRIISIDTVKSYIGLSGILRGEITISRLFISKHDVFLNRAEAEYVVNNLKKYAERKRRIGFSLKVKNIEIKNSGFSFYDENHILVAQGKGISADISLREEPRVSFYAEELSGTFKSLPVIKGKVRGMALLRKDGIDFKSLRINSLGSELSADGFYSFHDTTSFATSIDLFVSSIKKLFSLKKRGEGKIIANGSIKFGREIKELYINITTKGDFYLETLMEFLKAEKENLSGLVSFSGKLHGNISDLKAEGAVRLRNGTLFGISTNDLKCEVSLNNGIMSFRNGVAKLYNGEGSVSAEITIPKIKPYTVSVSVWGLDSSPLLEIIRLSWLRLAKGRVRGELYSEGDSFNPQGWFSYEGSDLENHPMGRVKYADGIFQTKNRVISLSKVHLRTDNSDAVFDSTVDIGSKTIEVLGSINTSDISDLISPYFKRLKGSAKMDVAITGTFDDPFIVCGLTAKEVKLDDYLIGDVDSQLSYKKSLFEIDHLEGKWQEKEIKVNGKVMFPFAKKPLDFMGPDYDLSLTLNQADLGGLLKVAKIKIPIKGRISSYATIKGRIPILEGSTIASDGEIYWVPFSQASFIYIYDKNSLQLIDTLINTKDSSITLKGEIFRKGDFKFLSSSDNLRLSTVIPRKIPLNYTMSFVMEGKGSLKDPDIELQGKLKDGDFKCKPIGSGRLSAKLKGNLLSIDAKLLDEMLQLNGSAEVNREFPWSLELEGSGRYDFLLSAFLKEVPMLRETSLSMKGSAKLKGSRRHVEADAVITQLNIAMPGYEFSNSSDIKFKLSDRRVFLEKVSVTGTYASFNTEGELEFGRSYNLSLNGKSSLSVLKMVSERIAISRGDSDFSLSIKGDWDRPIISGSLSVSNGTLAFKGIPQHLTSINGYLALGDSRIVIQRASARYGGGELLINGMINLTGFKIERFYLDTQIKDVTASLRKNLTLNLGGNLVLRGSSESQDIIGELQIVRARYRERIEWKSWLIEAKRKKPLKTQRWSERIRLSIGIRGEDNITIDNNLARASLKVDMVVRGTLNNPMFFGRIEAKEGKVYFRNNEFMIVTASADYAEHLRAGPYLGIVAQTFSKGYNIRLSLDGQPDRFNLSLHSDPPLGEIEILSLLTIGDFGERLKGLEGSIGAAEAASFLTGKYQDVLEERLKDITGIDMMMIDPYISKSTGSVLPRVTVSKKLIGERLFATYSTAVGAEEEIIKLEYLLASNISLMGIRDERGSLGGDIKFRFFFK